MMVPFLGHQDRNRPARTGCPPPSPVMLGQVTAWAVRLLRFPAGGLSCHLSFHWQIQEAEGTVPFPLSVQHFYFHAVFGKNVVQVIGPPPPPFRVGTSFHLRNSKLATMYSFNIYPLAIVHCNPCLLPHFKCVSVTFQLMGAGRVTNLPANRGGTHLPADGEGGIYLPANRGVPTFLP